MSGRQVAGLFALAALWGASFLFIRIGAPVLGPFPLMGGRVLAAALLLGAIAAARRQRIDLRPFARRLLVLGLIHSAAPFALIATAEVRLTASMTAVLMAVQPLFTALLGILLGERLTALRFTGLGLGVAGVAVLVGWSPAELDRSSLLVIGAVVLAALLYAAGSIYAHRRLSDAPVAVLAFGQQVAAAIWLAVPAALALPDARFEGGAVAAMLALAALSTALAYQIYFWLIASAGTVNASLVTYLIPPFGVLWGALFLREPIGPGMLSGLALILLSIFFVGRCGAGADQGSGVGGASLATSAAFASASSSSNRRFERSR